MALDLVVHLEFGNVVHAGVESRYKIVYAEVFIPCIIKEIA